MRSVFYLPRNCWRIAAALALVMGNLSSAADAAILIYSATMNGLNEAPPNASPGVGTAMITFDTTLSTMRVQANFSGLIGNTTSAHIHAATTVPGTGIAGVATTTPSFVGFPLGVNAGTMDQTFDMTLASSYNPNYVNANGGTTATAFTALLSSSAAGTAYYNIHSTFAAGGEIRGFLTAVPEPSSLLLTGIAMVGIGACYRRKRA
jgi:CHRD domain/PEP-CTERM motif